MKKAFLKGFKAGRERAKKARKPVVTQKSSSFTEPVHSLLMKCYDELMKNPLK